MTIFFDVTFVSNLSTITDIKYFNHSKYYLMNSLYFYHLIDEKRLVAYESSTFFYVHYNPIQHYHPYHRYQTNSFSIMSHVNKNNSSKLTSWEGCHEFVWPRDLRTAKLLFVDPSLQKDPLAVMGQEGWERCIASSGNNVFNTGLDSDLKTDKLEPWEVMIRIFG